MMYISATAPPHDNIVERGCFTNREAYKVCVVLPRSPCWGDSPVPRRPPSGHPYGDESVLVTAYRARDAVSRAGYRTLPAEATCFGVASRPWRLRSPWTHRAKGWPRPLQPMSAIASGDGGTARTFASWTTTGVSAPASTCPHPFGLRAADAKGEAALPLETHRLRGWHSPQNPRPGGGTARPAPL